MKVKVSIDEERNVTNFAQLDFDTGKRLMLSAEEWEELKNWVRLKQAERKAQHCKGPDREIKLPIGDIKIMLVDAQGTRWGGGSINSSLKEIPTDGDETEEELARIEEYNRMVDALESAILCHAIAGIDVETPQYLEGIKTALDACAHATT